ncbi:phosphoglucomutase 1 [Atractiella rhizophila]|nr:phosphoglucomutase 1 [Atractiella rhizophila]
MDSSVRELIQQWLALDKNSSTRAEIESLQASNNVDELRKRLSTRIVFGTAGLRAAMEAGFSRMNDVTVLQATQGLVAHLEAANSTNKSAVIGHDHRYNSQRFAELAAGVFLRKGWKVYLYRGVVLTPLVPFGVLQLKATAGIMITASHNPKNDNGYKLYASNGVQIIPPEDSQIEASILNNLDIADEAWDISNVAKNCEDRTEEMKVKYNQMAGEMVTAEQNHLNASSSVKFAYTPMHGVGLPFAKAAFIAAGFQESSFSIVEAQAQPDPEFPTVKFPNPEEKGALDLAIKHADANKCRIVLANDPDADRFTAAEKDPVTGNWKQFSGDQLGSILGHFVFQKYKAAGKDVGKLAVCASTVSSKMLKAIAKKEGFTFRETLTGFKWLGNEILKLKEEGYSAEYSYEEAIGFMLNGNVRDKDGVTALISFAQLAASQYQKGSTISAYLDDLYSRYGYFATQNSYFVSPSPDTTNSAFTALRYSRSSDGELALPESLVGGKYAVIGIRDLTVGYDSDNPPSFEPTLRKTEEGSHMITVRLAAGKDEDVEDETVITLRTSGTEPKIKYYIETRGRDRKAVEEKLKAIESAVGDEWLHWSEYGLKKAGS